ncbi:gluconate 2-dehydrogenase subunit 3 family protein [Thalassotalea profundi]|uniref:Twin-arginine translocation pathway signal protein n=1 Tax=Thalassotalea profundi TaxID=2036687 RepID=A0ABQ3J1K4_9GAMM|nr:gluconate 2-dehydrogenase subunit 3 family protein [Thalassotalea profundi]GHF01377.1 twin-arginine translocation pathway signal protein [Thalassotalea profundi]
MTDFSKNTSINENTRRSFLKQLTGAIGATTAYSLLSGNNLAIALAYNDNKELLDRIPLLFSKTQLITLASICQTIIPKTDTLGGADVDCHGFIDHQLFHCHTEEEQQNSLAIVNKIETISLQYFGHSFHKLECEIQTKVLNYLEMTKHFSSIDSNHFKSLKALIVFGYFTSEIGATKALNYQAVPGGYKGSIPYNENAKSWGSLSYY